MSKPNIVSLLILLTVPERFHCHVDSATEYHINRGLAHLDSLDISTLTVREQGKYNELINSLPDMLEVYYKEHDTLEIGNQELIEYEWLQPYMAGVFLCGKIDRFTCDKELFDLKTASEIGPNWKKRYKEEKLRDCGLALYDWYLNPKPKSIGMEVLVKPYKDKPSRLEPIPLNEIIQYRDRFKQQLNWVVKEMVHYIKSYSSKRCVCYDTASPYPDKDCQSCKGTGEVLFKPWPMNYGPMCMTKYGPCDYLPLCNLGDTPKNLAKYKTREEHLNVRKLAV